jgi:hypothetical protein
MVRAAKGRTGISKSVARKHRSVNSPAANPAADEVGQSCTLEESLQGARMQIHAAMP